MLSNLLDSFKYFRSAKLENFDMLINVNSDKNKQAMRTYKHA